MSAVVMTAGDLAGRLNLEKSPRSWRGNCPACGYARTFSVRAGRHDQPLVYCANGCDSKVLNQTLEGMFTETWRPAQIKDELDETAARARKAAEALRLWSGSVTNLADTPAARYLTNRGLAAAAPSAAFRFRGDCRHPEGGAYPALVAAVQNAAGDVAAVHRTYLTHAGQKAATEPAKASKGPVWGGAVRIAPAAPEIVIGEGIETSASAGILLGLPAWAAISAGNLERGVVLPDEIRSVVIAGDRDPVGERAAHAAAVRWRAEGRRVRIAWPTGDGDFNDLLVARAEVTHAA